MFPKRTLITCALLILSNYCYSNTYYVTTSGLASNTGALNSPWSIDHGFLTALSNDTVYVMAGNYGAVNLVVMNNNTSFIGYTATPGDLTAANIPDSLPEYYNNNYVLTYPTLDKNDKVSGGYGISISGKSGVLIKNFYIRNYSGASSVTGTGNIFENCIADGFGNAQIFYHGWGYDFYGNNNVARNCFLLNAGAQGITFKGNYNLIEDCQVYADDTTAFAATDYYILVTANTNTSEGNFNTVRNCHVERVGELQHDGHGFCLTTFYIHQACSPSGYCYDPSYRNDVVKYNIIENCTSKNVRELVLLRGPGVQENKLNNMVSESYGVLSITSGSKLNTFTNCLIKDPYYFKDPNSTSLWFNAGVEFSASAWGDTLDMNVSYTAQGSYPWEQNVCGESNKFINCVFQNAGVGVMFSSYSEFRDDLDNPVDRINRKIVKDNEFINCTFTGRKDTTGYLFMAMRGNSGNKFINCVVNGFPHYEGRYFPSSQTANALAWHNIIPTDFTFNHCNFYNNVFDSLVLVNGSITPTPPTPTITTGTRDSIAGTFINCNVADPGFVNGLANDYHLNNCVGCGTVDKGNSVAQMATQGYSFLTFDMDSAQRPCNGNYDIGAYEYQNCSVTAVKDYNKKKAVIIYPNPSTNIFNFLSESDIESIEITSSDGKLLFYNNYNSKNFQIYLSNFLSGIYFVKLKLKNEIIFSKIIIKTF